MSAELQGVFVSLVKWERHLIAAVNVADILTYFLKFYETNLFIVSNNGVKVFFPNYTEP